MDDDNHDEIAERYKFLMQPVKDLSKNWDIDISQFLEEYLAEKLSDRPSEEDIVDSNGRRKLFNFSEAAVVINGTTNVYCRKVEYVYQLASDYFEALSAINEKKNRRANEEADGGGGSDAGGEEMENPEDHRKRTNPYLRKLDNKSVQLLRRRFIRRLSRARPLYPATLLAFTPFDVFEKRSLKLLNRNGEIIGKRDDFKMNTCFVHKGSALLDLKNIDLINVFTKNFFKACRTKQLTVSVPPNPISSSLIPSSPPPVIYEDPTEEIAAEEVIDHPAATDEDRPLGDLLSVDDVEGTLGNVSRGSIDLQDDNFYDDNTLLDEPISEIPELDPTRPSSQVHHNYLVKHQLKNVGTSSATSKTAEALEEPFEPMDVFERRADKARPLVVNPKCIVMAAKQVEQRNKRIERECKEKGVPNVPLIKTYIDTQLFRRHIKKRSYAMGQFNSQLMDRALIALNELFYQEEKRRSQIKKTREAEERLTRRLAHCTSITQSASQISTGRTPSKFVPPSPIPSSPPPVIYEDPTEEIAAEEVIDYPADPDEHRPLGDLLSVDDLEDTLGVQHYAGMNVSKGSINLRNDTFFDDTFFDGPIGEKPEIDPTRPISQMQYDELVKYHLKKFWAVSHEATSKFAERVQKWEERIIPKLEKEQQHREFNTRLYSTDLIGAFKGGIGSELTLEQAISGHCESYELSRYLLTSLILTNMGNLRITKNELNDIRMQLTNTVRHDEMFDDEERLITGRR